MFFYWRRSHWNDSNFRCMLLGNVNTRGTLTKLANTKSVSWFLLFPLCLRCTLVHFNYLTAQRRVGSSYTLRITLSQTHRAFSPLFPPTTAIILWCCPTTNHIVFVLFCCFLVALLSPTVYIIDLLRENMKTNAHWVTFGIYIYIYIYLFECNL